MLCIFTFLWTATATIRSNLPVMLHLLLFTCTLLYSIPSLPFSYEGWFWSLHVKCPKVYTFGPLTDRMSAITFRDAPFCRLIYLVWYSVRCLLLVHSYDISMFKFPLKNCIIPEILKKLPTFMSSLCALNVCFRVHKTAIKFCADSVECSPHIYILVMWVHFNIILLFAPASC